MEMKAKFVSAIIVTMLLASIVSFIGFAYAHTATDPFVTDLIAGGGNPKSAIDVGDVLIWNDEDCLYVKYVITVDGWALAETHLAVATSLSGIPQTKTGNPIPGHFAYFTYHCPPVTEYVYQIPQTWADGATLYIAAHAKVVHIVHECIYVVSDPSVEWSSDGAAWFPTFACWVHPNWANIPGATWIWRTELTDPAWEYANVPDGGWYFKKAFTIPSSAYNIEASMVAANGDNAYRIAINGVSLVPDGEGAMSKDGPDNYEWSTIVNHAIPENTIVPGYNEIQLRAMNYFNWGDAYSNPAGLIFKMQLCYDYIDMEETAWGYGENFPGKNWATYITYGWEWSERWPETGTAYIGYEDWTGGDFDYNDFGMSMVVTEFKTPSGIEEIDIRCQGLVKLAGWHHKIHISLTDSVTAYVHLEEWDKTETTQYRSEDYTFTTGEIDVLLFDDTATDVGHITTVHITFEEPVTLTRAPPYDPYIYVINQNAEFHIGDAQLKTTPAGDAHLPYILDVPVTWLPPAEGCAIWDVYGYFDDFYVTGSPTDWYSYLTGPNPTVPYVPYP